MNYIEERSILARFKKLYERFPLGKTTQPDKPDFIITGEQKIGIEITQVFKDQNSTNGSLIKARHTFQRHLLSNITSSLKSIDFPKSIFAIHLNDNLYSKKLDVREISKLCFLDILSKRAEIDGDGEYNFENEGALPPIIEGYSISVIEGIQEIEFLETSGVIGLPLTNEYIQFALNKKEKAKIGFKKCDSYWLLIKEGSGAADYFGSLLVNKNTLITTFDKVFLFRQMNSEIIELK